MTRVKILIAAGLACLAAPAIPRPALNTGVPTSIQQLLGCRTLADTGQRLACYDRQTGVLSGALASRELIVIDKVRANAAKRSLFGFSVPDFGGIFGGGNDAEVKEIASTVTRFGHNPDGGWVISLADGSTWSQTDDAQLGLPPERGQKVVVHRGTFGNFFLRLNGQPGFKAKRIG